MSPELKRGEKSDVVVFSISEISDSLGPPPENIEILGDHDTAPINVHLPIMLNQTRGGRNPKVESLQASIESETKLLNKIDLAAVPKDLFDEYYEFTKELWGENSIDIPEPIDIAGVPSYVVVIAGHSRLQAMRGIAEDNNTEYWTEAKFHHVSSVSDIVRIQLHENIHANVPPENEALAIAEAWHWDKAKDPELTKIDFIVENNLKGYDQLNRAIAYSALPGEIRKLVGEGAHFGVITELGVAQETYLEYYWRKHYPDKDLDELTDEEQEKIEADSLEDINRHLGHYSDPKRGKKRSRMAVTRIQKDVVSKKEKIERIITGDEVDAAPLEVIPFFERDVAVTEARRELTKTIRELRQFVDGGQVKLVEYLAKYSDVTDQDLEEIIKSMSDTNELIEIIRALLERNRGRDIKAKSYKEATQETL